MAHTPSTLSADTASSVLSAAMSPVTRDLWNFVLCLHAPKSLLLESITLSGPSHFSLSTVVRPFMQSLHLFVPKVFMQLIMLPFQAIFILTFFLISFTIRAEAPLK